MSSQASASPNGSPEPSANARAAAAEARRREREKEKEREREVGGGGVGSRSGAGTSGQEETGDGAAASKEDEKRQGQALKHAGGGIVCNVDLWIDDHDPSFKLLTNNFLNESNSDSTATAAAPELTEEELHDLLAKEYWTTKSASRKAMLLKSAKEKWADQREAEKEKAKKIRAAVAAPYDELLSDSTVRASITKAASTYRSTFVSNVKKQLMLIFPGKDLTDPQVRLALIEGDTFMYRDMEKPTTRSAKSEARFLGPGIKIVQAALFGSGAVGKEPANYPSAKERIAELCGVDELTPEVFAMAQTVGLHALDDMAFTEYGHEFGAFVEGKSELLGVPPFKYQRYGEYYEKKLMQVRGWFNTDEGKKQVKVLNALIFPPHKHKNKKPRLAEDFVDGTEEDF